MLNYILLGMILITAAASTGCGSQKKAMKSQTPVVNERLERLAALNFEQLCIGYLSPDRLKTPGEILNTKPIEGVVTSKYGPRKLKTARKAKLHKGIDLSAQKGTKVKAAGQGEVSFLGNRNGYGKVVEISHGEGLVTRYAHLDSYGVKIGQNVSAGTSIDTLGRSGRTTGPNLHFEVLLEDKPINPHEILPWL